MHCYLNFYTLAVIARRPYKIVKDDVAILKDCFVASLLAMTKECKNFCNSVVVIVMEIESFT